MSSFLTDVLKTAGKFGKINLPEKVIEIQKEITTLDENIKTFMDDNLVEFTSKFTRDQHLVEEAARVIEETENLQKRIDNQIKVQISGSTTELRNLSNALKESNIGLQLCNKLLCFYQCIKSIKNHEENKQYLEAALSLTEMKKMLANSDSDLSKLDIYKAINENYSNLHDVFLSNVTSLLDKRIVRTSTNSDTSENSLTINDKLKDLRDLILALHYTEDLSNYLKIFSEAIMEKFVKPIIEYDCSVYVVDEKIFTVKILNKQKMSSYMDIPYNLQLLFTFFHEHLNIVIQTDQTFLKMLEPHLLKPLVDSLITQCVSRAFPPSTADFKKFDPIIESMEKFQNFLLEIGFITADQLFVSEYAKKLDEHIFNSYISETLVKARHIMKKPLHVSFTYEPQVAPESADITNDSNDFHNFDINGTLETSTFELPKCQISVSAREILELVRSILDEASHLSDTLSDALFYTCRTIFEMYAGFMLEYHWKFLETIPQHVALLQNSCIYLAHHLLTLGHEYRNSLLKGRTQLNFTFADQVTTLRDTAAESMLTHLRYQRDIIIDILKESGLAALGHATKLNQNTECQLRQCIRQLELLKTVWIDVLPIKMYCRVLGCVTNSMVEELIIRVISVEDIRANVATELQVVFGVVVSRVPPIFPVPDEISQHVPMWEKFVQLINVLGATMKEIEVGWGNGKGPYARVFTSAELKQLIRALFQNTERRSELLSGIKGNQHVR